MNRQHKKFRYEDDIDVVDIVDNPKTNEPLLHKITLKCKNEHQKEFVKLIEDNQITICIGDSGVGKSYLSLAKALELLKDRANGYNKLYIITPLAPLEEENPGFLKGDLNEKMAPHLYSIYYIIDGIIGSTARKKLVEMEMIMPLALSFIRGTNLDNCIMISDETQNMSITSIKTLLTRIGRNSKFILSGDVNQIDRFRRKEESGLVYAFENLKGIEGIGFFEFDKSDIVRNPIIGKILERFEV